MALGDPYISEPELADYMQTTSASDSLYLTWCCESATQNVNQLCGRQFNKSDTATARTFSPSGQYVSTRTWETTYYSLFVDDFWTDTGLAVSDGDTALTVADLVLHPRGGVVEGMTGWPYTRIDYTSPYYGDTLTVTAKWGWAAVPAPVRQATLILAAEMFKMKDAPLGVAGFGDFGVVRVRENPMVMRLLAPYRLRVPFVA